MLDPRTKRRWFLFAMTATSAGVVAYSAWLLWPVWQEYRAVRRLLQTVRYGDQQAVDGAVAEVQKFRWKGVDAVTELVTLLSSKTGGVRWRAAYALGEMGESVTDVDSQLLRDRAVPALVEALSDEHVRIRAAYALGQIGSEARAAIPQLMSALDHEEQYFNGQAGHALARIGEPAIDSLLEAAAGGSGQRSLRSIDTLGEMGEVASKRSLPALLAAFEHGNADIQSKAASAIAKCRRPAVPELVRLLRAKKGRGLIAHALAEIGPDAKDAIPALIEAICESGPYGDTQLASAIGEIGGAAELVKALDVEAARFSVIQAITQRGPAAREAIPSVLDVLKTDRRPEIRNAAAGFFMQLGPEASDAVPALVEILREPATDRESDVRYSVLQALMRMGPAAEAAVPDILQLISPNEPVHIEIMAAVALCSIDLERPELLPALMGALKRDPYYHDRVQAIYTLGQLGPRAAVAVPLLIEELGKEPAAQTRQAAVVALGKIGPAAADAVPMLIRVVVEEESPQSWIRISAIQALGSIGPAANAAVPTLTELKKTSNPIVQQAAERALRMIEQDAVLER